MYVPDGVPSWPFKHPEASTHNNTTAVMRNAAPAHTRRRMVLCREANATSASSRRSQGNTTGKLPGGKFGHGPPRGAAVEVPVVAIVTVAVPGVAPLIVNAEGESVQVVNGAVTVQASATLPVKPPVGVTVTV